MKGFMKDIEDNFVALILCFAVSAVLGITLGIIWITDRGIRGQSCFGNSTCMKNLTCLHGDGHEPGTCVKPADGGSQ